MIGLALVTFVAVLASGITSSFRDAVNKIWHNADYAVTAQNNFDPIPIAAANAASTFPGSRRSATCAPAMRRRSVIASSPLR